MNITLKNIKHFEPMSHETHCFTATVYIDGKRTFTVENDGHGGCDNYGSLTGYSNTAVLDLIKTINTILNKEILTSDGDTINNNLEIVISDLVNKWLVDKAVKKELKKLCYVKNGEIYHSKASSTKENIIKIKNAPWWKSDFILLNELHYDKAKQFFIDAK